MSKDKTYRREELEMLTSRQLDQILRAEVEKPGMDEEVILQILDILESREADSPTTPNIDVDAAWNEFKTSYMVTPKEAPVSNKKPKQKPQRHYRWIGSIAAMLAIVCMLLVAAPKAQGAMNIFEILGRWTESIFEFFNTGTSSKPQQEYVFETDHPGLQQIYDAVKDLGVTQPVVPTWVPDGYELLSVEKANKGEIVRVQAEFVRDKETIIITIRRCENDSTFTYSKDEEGVEVYEIAGIDHYVINNKDQWMGAWVNDGIECLIIADHSKEDIIEIMRSIYLEGD